jgi:hypothetical protein
MKPWPQKVGSNQRKRPSDNGLRPPKPEEPHIEKHRPQDHRIRDDPELESLPIDNFYPHAAHAAFPTALKTEIHAFRSRRFSRDFFNSHLSGHLFMRDTSALEKDLFFQAHPIERPILARLPHYAYGAALESFDLILLYTGASADPTAAVGSGLTVNRLCQLALSEPAIWDEIFCQLIKQTARNPDAECLRSTWDLFLVMACTVPCSRDIELWVRSYLARRSRDRDKEIATFAQFTHIRLTSRCGVGKPLASLPLRPVVKYVQEMIEGYLCFGVSIYEQVWHQRHTWPSLPIPYVLHRIISCAMSKGVLKKPRIFRDADAENARVRHYADDLNSGQDSLEFAELCDVVSLLIKWFRDLPVPIICEEMMPKLRNAAAEGRFIDFVEGLPLPLHLTLRYFTGFVRDVVNAQEITRMSSTNVAEMFGPLVVYGGGVRDAFVMRRFRDISIRLIAHLIERWDTTDIYPLDPSLLKRSDGENKQESVSV